MCRVPHTKSAYGPTLAERAETLARWLDESAKVLVGAGAGLSVAAGIDYTDEEDFARHFPALVRRGLRARYQLIGYDGLDEPAFWGYWASHVQQIRFTPRHSIGVRAALRPAPREGLLCADVQRGCHVRATWLRRLARLFHPRRLCADAVPDPLSPGGVAERARRRVPGGGTDPATQEVTDRRVIPRCRHCGGEVFLNVRAGDWFVDAPHLPAVRDLNSWVRRAGDAYPCPGHWVRVQYAECCALADGTGGDSASGRPARPD